MVGAPVCYTEGVEDETETRLRQEIAELEQINGKLARILTETADALKGDPGPLHLHDWSDLPAVASRSRALLSWIDGALVDERPHMEIREAIYRYYRKVGGDDTSE